MGYVNLINSAGIHKNYILLIASITFALFINMNKLIMPGNIEFHYNLELELYLILN